SPSSGSRLHHYHVVEVGNPHVELTARGLLDATEGGPGALLQQVLAPLHLQAALLLLQRRQLGVELAAQVAGVDNADGGDQQQRPQHQQRTAGKGAHRATFSATRITALRARTLLSTSSASALTARPTERRRRTISASRTGTPRGIAGPCSSRRMKRLTMRSSREWKLITTRRPPGLRVSMTVASSASRSSSSRLTWMRMAWKARVAGCLPFSQAGLAAATISASWRVRVMGFRARSRTMAAAMRRANFTSP